jgi:hypothetical protein
MMLWVLYFIVGAEVEWDEEIFPFVQSWIVSQSSECAVAINGAVIKNMGGSWEPGFVVVHIFQLSCFVAGDGLAAGGEGRWASGGWQDDDVVGWELREIRLGFIMGRDYIVVYDDD